MVKYRFAEVDVGGKKFYAVIFSSGERHIYDNWAECEKKVKGRSKVKYKGFLSRQDAELFLGGRPIQKNNDDIAVYVDGAFLSHYSSYAGYGWVAVQNDREIARGYGCTEYPAKSRNVDGELKAALAAAAWAVQHNHKVCIVHDYTGVSKWAEGKWKARQPVSIKYKKLIKKYLPYITFAKVTAHSHNKWNDLADELARKGITEAAASDYNSSLL